MGRSTSPTSDPIQEGRRTTKTVGTDSAIASGVKSHAVVWRSIRLVVLACWLFRGRGETNGSLDLSFDPGTGADGPVFKAVFQPDGKLIVVGAFTNFNGISRRGIARLQENGAIDPSFDPGTGSDGPTVWWALTPTVRAVVLQSDGKIVIGGDFTSFDGVPCRHLARLNSDGSVDTEFVASVEPEYEGSPETVHALSLQSDGKILVGGRFGKVNGVTGFRFARLNTDSSLDESFDTRGQMGYDDTVEWILPLPTGHYVVGGTFGNFSFPEPYELLPYSALRKLSPTGQRDKEFEQRLPVGRTYTVGKLNSNGNVLVTALYDANIQDYAPERSFLDELRSDGTRVASLALGTESSIGAVQSLPDGRWMLGGGFTELLGKDRSHIARLLANRDLDVCYPVDLQITGRLSQEPTTVYDLQLNETQTKVLLVGNFTTVNGLARAGIALLILEESCLPGTVAFAARAVSVRQDAGIAQVTVIRTGSGNAEASIGFETREGTAQAGIDYQPVSTRVVFKPGELTQTVAVPLVFTSRTSNEGERVLEAMLRDATGGEPLVEPNVMQIRIQASAGVETLAVQNPAFKPNIPDDYSTGLTLAPDGRWYQTRCLWEPPRTYTATIQRLNPDFTIDPSFNMAPRSDRCIFIGGFMEDGRIFVWDGYSSSDGSYAILLDRLNLDGTVDLTFHRPIFQRRDTNSVAGLSSIQLLPGNRVIVSGRFVVEAADQIYRNAVVLGVDGKVESSFALEVGLESTQSVEIHLIYPDGRILASVSTLEGGTYRYDFYRVFPDGSRDPTFQFNAAALFYARPIRLLPDGKILAIRSVDGKSTPENPALVRLNPDGTRDPSFVVPEIRPEPLTNGWSSGVWLTDVVPLPDGSVLVGGQFGFVGGLRRPSLVRLLPNGNLDVGFTVDLPTLVENEIPYRRTVRQFVKVDANSLWINFGYDALEVTDRFQFWRLEEIQLEPSNEPSTIQLPAIAPNPVSEAGGEIVFDVYRTGAATDPASIQYRTAPRTAKSPDDYLSQTGELRFLPGERQKQIHVPLVDDATVEPDEVFDLILSEPQGATLSGEADIEGTIVNDENGIEFESSTYRFSEAEGVAVLYVRLTGTKATPVTVDYTTRDVTAKGGEHYVSFAGRADFTYWGSSPVPIFIRLLDDGVANGDRNFEVVLSNPTRGAVLDRTTVATVTITDNDTSQRPGVGVDGIIKSLAVEDNGRILLAGQFTRVNGQPRTSVARLMSDLQLDTTFTAPFQSGTSVERVAVQADGKVLVTGVFTNLQGVSLPGLLRLNADGQFDPTFISPAFVARDYPSYPSSGWSIPPVQSLLPLPDGRILVGGHFTSVNGLVRVGIARLNPDGSVDRSFGHGTFLNEPAVATAYATALALLPDGNILMGGRATTFRNVYQSTVVRLEPDGGLDREFKSNLARNWVWGGYIPFPVQSLCVKRNGQILVLSAPDGASYDPPLVLLNADGSPDPTFAANIGPVGNNPWEWRDPFLPTGGNAVLETRDGRVWLGAKERLVAIEADGSYNREKVTALSATLGQRRVLYDSLPTSNGLMRYSALNPVEITALVMKKDGRILIAGDFGFYDGLPASGLVEVDETGARWDILRIDDLDVADKGTGVVRLRVRAPTGQPYTLERSMNLETWDVILRATASEHTFEFTDSEPLTTAQRYYRLRAD